VVEDCRSSSPIDQTYVPLSAGRGGVSPDSTNLGGEFGPEHVVDSSLVASPLENVFPCGAPATSCDPGRASSLVPGHPSSNPKGFRMVKASTSVSHLTPTILSCFREPELEDNFIGDMLETLVHIFKEVQQPVSIPTF